MDDWKRKTTPVVRLQRLMFVYILLLGVKFSVFVAFFPINTLSPLAFQYFSVVSKTY